MIELALVTGWTLDELRTFDDAELATIVDALEARAGGRRSA